MGASVSASSSSSHSPQPEAVFLHPSFLGGPSSLSPAGVVDHANKEKKRKSTTLSTLRRRLIRKRRTSKSFDHAQMFRAFLSSWTKKEVVALVEGYETLAILKELSSQADTARLEANTCRQDLGELFDSKYFSDLNLIYQGVTFQVHRALLAARCPFFRELLNDVSLTCSEVMVDIDIAGMSVQMFSDLLKYLYTGELSVTEKSEGSLNVLYQLSEQFGIPNPLEQDLKFLLDTGMYSDAILVFLSGHKQHSDSKESASHGDDFEIPCHTVVLAARSPFFRNVIRRHFERQASVLTFSPARIILDEMIIPRRFAKIIVQALYQDVPDFSLLIHNHAGSVNDLQLGQKDPLEETMQLYEIAKFLEMDALALCCEDAVVESLSLETVVPVLQWSRQPHGSQWVRRQALAFLREEFTAVSSSSTLFHIDKADLGEVIQSDFLQASELEVLQAVLRWGEQHLLKRMEEREPNLVSQTAHSVSRRGLKRRDLCDVELREILGDVLCHVRADHILPPDSEIFLAAIKRGLICSMPPHMLGDEIVVGPHQKTSSWVRGTKGGKPFVRPRLFTPYVEEAKAWLEEEYGQDLEISHSLNMWQISHIPDALYMVEKPFPEEEQWYEPANLDIVKGIVLDNSTFKLLKKREEELRKSSAVQKAYKVTRNPGEVSKLVLLRVVREFGLPDLSIDILHKSAKLCPEEVPEMPEHKAPLELSRPAQPQQVHRRFCSEHHLSGIIPDIAMATSLMGRMQLLDCDISAGPERLAPVQAKRRGKEAGSRCRRRFLYWPRFSDSGDC